MDGTQYLFMKLPLRGTLWLDFMDHCILCSYKVHTSIFQIRVQTYIWANYIEFVHWVAQTWPCFDKLRIVSVNNQDRVFRPYLKTFMTRLNRTKCEDVGFNFCSWKAWLVKSLITPLSILRGVHQTYPFWHFCKGFLSRRLLMTRIPVLYTVAL